MAKSMADDTMADDTMADDTMAQSMAESMADDAAHYDRIIIKNKCTISDDCAICLDSLLSKQIIYLPCKHFFHLSCLKYSLDNKLYTCPLCRYDLVNALIKSNFKFPYTYNMGPYFYANAYAMGPYAYNIGPYAYAYAYAMDPYAYEDDLLWQEMLYTLLLQEYVPAPVLILPEGEEAEAVYEDID